MLINNKKLTKEQIIAMATKNTNQNKGSSE